MSWHGNNEARDARWGVPYLSLARSKYPGNYLRIGKKGIPLK